MFEIILLSLDQTRESMRSVQKAIELAKHYGSKLILLQMTIAQDNFKTKSYLSVRFKEWLQKEIQANDIVFKIIESKTDLALDISELANKLNVDLIIMDAARENLDLEISGKIAKVIELVSCPVLVVP